MNIVTFWGLNVRCPPWTHSWSGGGLLLFVYLFVIVVLFLFCFVLFFGDFRTFRTFLAGESNSWGTSFVGYRPHFQPKSFASWSVEMWGVSATLLSLTWALPYIPGRKLKKKSPSSLMLLRSGIFHGGEKTKCYSSLEQRQPKGKPAREELFYPLSKCFLVT